MALRPRAMNDEEIETIRRLAHSRTAPARAVQRARIVWLAHRGQRVSAIAQELHLTPTTVRSWLKRFNGQGLTGLEEQPRPGRPATYSPEQVSEVIATALTDPQTLSLPFACWTLDRLQAYLNEGKGIWIKRTRIDELLLAKACAGASRKLGLASGWIPLSPKKGAHHDALYGAAPRKCRSVSG